MAEIAPLQPLRYDPERLARVVAPPYDVIDPPLRARLALRDPQNVVHIDLPEGDGDQRYDNAGRLFQQWQAEGVLVREPEPAFWRYEQSFDPPEGGARITRKGFFALVRAVPFAERQVLPHERTLTGPKLDRQKLSRATGATLSPGFMLYSDPKKSLDPELDSGERLADFETDDGVRHRLSRLTAPAAIERIVRALSGEKLLIADGHHRYETAVMLAREIDERVRAQGGRPSERGEHLFMPALLVNGDDPGLVVFPTHRLMHALGDFEFERLLAAAGDLFEVERAPGDADALRLAVARSSRPAIGAIASGGRAAILSLRPGADLAAHPVLGKRPEVVRATGVALLHDAIIEHLLGVTPEAQAAKTNIRYLQDARGGAAAVERGEGQVLFVMAATPVATIRAVAEAGQVMPQKSTFFHPKVPTGLLFHTLDPSRGVA
jgi:uncharacterized protein (DUF1015 family)